MDDVIQTKRCPKCERVLPLSEFSRNKSQKDGLQIYCKQCHKAMRHESYVKHRGERLKNAAEYRANNKETIAQKNAEWYATHKDAILKKHADYNAIYYNPILSPLGWAKSMVNGYRKMDKERGFDTSQTITADWFVQNIMYKPCAHCGLLQVGAIGANRLNNNIGHEASNLEPCCRNCNSRLGAIYQIERGLAWFQKGKKQSFSSFVEEHKAKHKKD